MSFQKKIKWAPNRIKIINCFRVINLTTFCITILIGCRKQCGMFHQSSKILGIHSLGLTCILLSQMIHYHCKWLKMCFIVPSWYENYYTFYRTIIQGSPGVRPWTWSHPDPHQDPELSRGWRSRTRRRDPHPGVPGEVGKGWTKSELCHLPPSDLPWSEYSILIALVACSTIYELAKGTLPNKEHFVLIKSRQSIVGFNNTGNKQFS